MARHLLAVQAQDPRGFRLAIRARTVGVSAADVDAALTEERSLVVTWLNRGTLHLVCAEDYRWLHSVTAPRLRHANARRLAQTGVTAAAADRGVEVVVRSLGKEGPLTRQALRSRLSTAGVPTGGQALIHLLARVSIDGLVVRGPVVDGQQRYVLVSDWLGRESLGTETDVDQDLALGELALRYLVGHGPATAQDLAVWAGVSLGEARKGLLRWRNDLVELPGGLLHLKTQGDDARLPPARLLGPFDPLLHGWRDRRALLGDDRTVVTNNGVFRPILLAGGRAVATWGLAGDVLHVRPFLPLSDPVLRSAGREAIAVAEFLGVGHPRVRVDGVEPPGTTVDVAR